jgi:hypothetical protein
MADTEVNVDVPDEGEVSPREEIEIAVGEAPPEPKPDVVSMSAAEFAELKARSDSAQAIQKGIEGLGAKMQAPAAPQQQVVNAPQQTPEEFYAEHADDFFDKEKAPKLMRQYNKMIMEQEYGPAFSSMSAQLATTRKELLASRDPLYKKYESEVEQLVQAQAPNVRVQSDVYDRAWLTIREKHRTEIEEESINTKVADAVAAKLKEYGIDPDKKVVPPRPDAYVNSAGRSAGATTANGKKTVRLPNEETRIRLENEARKRGMEFTDLLRAKGYME